MYQNYPSFMAPQTEIPLTGEMSRSDKRVTARYEQLEPVTLNMLSATAVASLYRYDKTIHRIVLSATDNSRVTLLRCDVAGERTVQRCRQKQKDRTSCDLFRLAPQTGLEPVTPRLTAACSANWAIEAYSVLLHFNQVLEPVTGLKHSRLARLERFAILLVSSYSTDQLFVHRTVDPSRQLTAACSANWAIEAYSVCRSELKKYKRFMFNHIY